MAEEEIKFRDYYAAFNSAAGHRIWICPGQIDDIEEYMEDDKSRCNIYTKSTEHVVAHSIEEVFTLIEMSLKRYSEKRARLSADRSVMVLAGSPGVEKLYGDSEPDA